MLVLSRRRSEQIVINDDIVITVVDIERNGQVRLGIEAPRSYRVLRSELYRQIEAENRQASRAPAAAIDILSQLHLSRPAADQEE